MLQSFWSVYEKGRHPLFSINFLIGYFSFNWPASSSRTVKAVLYPFNLCLLMNVVSFCTFYYDVQGGSRAEQKLDFKAVVKGTF